MGPAVLGTTSRACASPAIAPKPRPASAPWNRIRSPGGTRFLARVQADPPLRACDDDLGWYDTWPRLLAATRARRFEEAEEVPLTTEIRSARTARSAFRGRRDVTGQGLPGRHLVTLEVPGLPASYSTVATAPWKEAVRTAVTTSGIAPVPTARFAVGIDLRMPAPLTANHVWDLDNLVKPTLDALEGVFGLRRWAGRPQAADDRVDHLVASKRTVDIEESPGATITIHVLAP